MTVPIIPRQVGGVIDAEGLVDRQAAGRRRRIGAVAKIIVVAHIRAEQIAPAGRAREHVEIKRGQRFERWCRAARWRGNNCRCPRASRRSLPLMLTSAAKAPDAKAPRHSQSRCKPIFSQHPVLLVTTAASVRHLFKQASFGNDDDVARLQANVVLGRAGAALEGFVVEHQNGIGALHLSMDLDAAAGRERAQTAGKRDGLRHIDRRLCG